MKHWKETAGILARVAGRTAGSLSGGCLAANVSAAVVVLADRALVTTEMIATLVERYRETGAPLAVSWPLLGLADLDVPEDYEPVKARLAEAADAL